MRILLMLFVASVVVACGNNVFSSYEKKDPAEDATVAMENHKPDKAIAILTDALADDPGNKQFLGLLAAATAQKYGIDTISLALKLGTPSETEGSTSSSTSGTSTNGITLLFPVLPAATAESIAGVQSAIDYLLQIPEAERTTADNFYLTLLNTALVGLQTKLLDADGDGQISPVELLDMSDDAAISILESLINAQSALAAGITGGESSQVTSSSVSGIKEKIDAQPGSTDAEKLRNYLGGAQTPPAS